MTQPNPMTQALTSPGTSSPPTATTSAHALPLAHGGLLVQRWAAREEMAREVEDLGIARLRLLPHQLSDALLIASGGFSPLTGFLGARDYASVLEGMRLEAGALWPIPVTLTLRERPPSSRLRERLLLLDEHGSPVGRMDLEEVYEIDPSAEARRIYGTEDARHPGVARVLAAGRLNLGGSIQMLREAAPVAHAGYPSHPLESRALFAQRGWRTVVAFQTRNPIHRAHEYIQKCALEIVDGLFLHPLVGETHPDDVPAEVRMRCYEALLHHYYPARRTLMGVYPAAMRYAGPREAVFHALARKNYGCSHFIVGRDHAGVAGFYGTYAAQEIFRDIPPADLGIVPLFFDNTFWCRSCGHMASEKTCPHSRDDQVLLSGSDVRSRLTRGEDLPPEFTRLEVAQILRAHYRGAPAPATPLPEGVGRRPAPIGATRPEPQIPAAEPQPAGSRSNPTTTAFHPAATDTAALRATTGDAHGGSRGAFTLWLTGLSGAGKTTIARLVAENLREAAVPLEILDGDVVRANLSPDLGFEKRDRDMNIRRIAFVTQLLVRHGVNVIVAAISPFREEREFARFFIGPARFIEAFIDCPLEVCMKRDVKGLYARAMAGEIKNFTGLTQPYEAPSAPQLVVATGNESPEESAARVLGYLRQEGWLPALNLTGKKAAVSGV
jgi:sulfate adenylyltransferase